MNIKKKRNTIKDSSKNKKRKFSCQNSVNKTIISSDKKIYTELGNKENNKENKEQLNDVNELNDYELNSLDYKDAIKIDQRTYIQYYCSLIRTKHLLIFTFYFNKAYIDYNSYIIKIELFLFAFALYLTVSALFFNDDTIHDIYEDNEFLILFIIFLKLFIHHLFLVQFL